MQSGKSDHKLDVYLNHILVGTLVERGTGAMEFTYDQIWLSAAGHVPISQSLPLTSVNFKGDKVRSFFENLLPDSIEVRRKMAACIGSESTSDFDLLSTVGRDCVGSFQFVPHGSQLMRPKSISGTKVGPAKIAMILENLPNSPLGNLPEAEFRISIAGAQDKTGFLWKDKSWFIPSGSTPTTHIFKVPMGKLPNGIDFTTSLENEWLCLKLVSQLGLKVAEAKILRFKTQKSLTVTRFDRKWIKFNEQIERLHQEDLCQALGYSVSRKYESDGGPGIVEIMEFLRESDAPNEDREIFFRAQIIFFMLGATDGHAKNFSIFNTSSGFRLTPLYDVLSVYPAWSKRQIRKNQMKMSMAVGDNRHYILHEIRRRHWEQTGRTCGLSSERIHSIIDDLICKVEVLLGDWIKLPKNYPEWLSSAISEGLRNSLHQLRRERS